MVRRPRPLDPVEIEALLALDFPPGWRRLTATAFRT
jgi:hypothetical protein